MRKLKKRSDKTKYGGTQWVGGPNKKTRIILNRAWELIESVPYKVPGRWVFYRLYQEGFYKEKDGYNNCIGLLSRARKHFYKGWTPTTLADESRPTAGFGAAGQATIHDCFEKYDIPNSCASALGSCFLLSHFYRQDYYVEVWFEAKAMLPQFQHYTNNVILRPFGGQYTVRPKWEAAKEMEKNIRRFGKPGVVLYFGDCDKHGKEIPQNAIKDVEYWCDEEIKFVFCGLTTKQAKKFDIPEKYDDPDKYQWEAIPDDKARKLITSNVDRYVKKEIIAEVRAEEKQAVDEWEPKVVEALEELFEN
jgi:hypothetical protein